MRDAKFIALFVFLNAVVSGATVMIAGFLMIVLMKWILY